MNKVDCVIGAIGNYNYDQIKYWVNSLNRSGFSGRKILLSYNSNFELVHELVKNGIEVYEMTHDSFAHKVEDFPCHTGYITKENTELLVHHIRFWHMYQLIKELGEQNFRYIIHTDVRDVVFQQNPSLKLNNLSQTGKTIVAPSEYLTYDIEKWNQELGLTNFGAYIHNFILKDSLVYNVGSFAAETTDFLNICLMTYLMCYRRNKLADQPSQAILFNTVLKDKLYTATMKDGWALQCGTIAETNTYEKYKQYFKELPPIIKDGYVCNSSGDVFSIVHQYERVPEFKNLLERKFN